MTGSNRRRWKRSSRRRAYPQAHQFVSGAACGAAAHNRCMNLIAIVLSVLAILLVILTAILPVIGAIFAWLALGIGAIGLVFGLLSKNTSGRNISILACVLAGFRLALGGGII
jgi:small-conductance mechanosensitive channel